jgi:hypothetical protein
MATDRLRYQRDMARELAQLAAAEQQWLLAYLFGLAERAADELLAGASRKAA